MSQETMQFGGLCFLLGLSA